ncbi:hypothetical protein [Acinetobacter guillouiae]|uniref:hypothetical protein n=1 Tax=Acinetobacter guillouiae TaxID=106649 RepID=UPI0026E32DED|nr:hypothetical protein [Acinetobacter guillouiae]MDO6646328.1 hypothetical protein [Acinetobacter guillouiae]
MDKFEEWWKTNGAKYDYVLPASRDSFKAGQQSRQAEVEELKSQLAKMVHDKNLSITKQAIEIDEKDKRIESQLNCIENLVVQKSVYLDKVTKTIAHLDSFDHSKACINKLQRSIECALEALRGEHANS